MPEWSSSAGGPGGGSYEGLVVHWLFLLITFYPHFRWKEVRTIKQPEPPQVKRMNLNVPVELHNAFKSATAAEGSNMTDTLLDYIKRYVAEHSPLKPKGRRK